MSFYSAPGQYSARVQADLMNDLLSSPPLSPMTARASAKVTKPSYGFQKELYRMMFQWQGNKLGKEDDLDTYKEAGKIANYLLESFKFLPTWHRAQFDALTAEQKQAFTSTGFRDVHEEGSGGTWSYGTSVSNFYPNINFLAGADDWNNIYTKKLEADKVTSWDPSKLLFNGSERDSYLDNEVEDAVGFTDVGGWWGRAKSVINEYSRNNYAPSQNYLGSWWDMWTNSSYNSVASGLTGNALTEHKLALMTGMVESRSRYHYAMNEILGLPNWTGQGTTGSKKDWSKNIDPYNKMFYSIFMMNIHPITNAMSGIFGYSSANDWTTGSTGSQAASMRSWLNVSDAEIESYTGVAGTVQDHTPSPDEPRVINNLTDELEDIRDKFQNASTWFPKSYVSVGYGNVTEDGQIYDGADKLPDTDYKWSGYRNAWQWYGFKNQIGIQDEGVAGYNYIHGNSYKNNWFLYDTAQSMVGFRDYLAVLGSEFILNIYMANKDDDARRAYSKDVKQALYNIADDEVANAKAEAQHKELEKQIQAAIEKHRAELNALLKAFTNRKQQERKAEQQ